MSYTPGNCVGSTYDQLYSSNTFSTGSIATYINDAAKQYLINPATLASISSMETESAGFSDNCSPCYEYGVGVCQIGKAMFDDWNTSTNAGATWCSSICGSPGYIPNLQIVAQYLYGAFSKLQSLGVTNQVQMMAMAATSYNGLGSCTTGVWASFQPFGGGYYPLPYKDGITEYGSSAGYLFANSGHVGSGVFDYTQTL